MVIYGDAMYADHLIGQDGTEGLQPGSGASILQGLYSDEEALSDYIHDNATVLGRETLIVDNGEGDYTTYYRDVNGDLYLLGENGQGTLVQGEELAQIEDKLISREGGDDTIIGTQGGDLIFGQEGNDIVLADGNDATLKDIAEKLGVENNQPTVDSMIQAIQDLGDDPQSGSLKNFLDNVEGDLNDGNDQLYGGTGDDLLFGMGGDDYLNGGTGADYLFGGSGNDIIVYDQNDYMVSGGEGIDFMVTDKSEVTLDTLGTSGRDGNPGPIVDGIDVLIKGDDALSLTNMEQLFEEYGVTIGENNTISLDDRWTPVDGNGHMFAFEGNNLTIEISNELTVQAAKQQIEQG